MRDRPAGLARVRRVNLPVCGEKQTGGSGGSLEPPGLLLKPPGPLLTHPHTVHMACSECLPTRLNPLRWLSGRQRRHFLAGHSFKRPFFIRGDPYTRNSQR
jgi:hypothetical protein